MSRGQKWSAVAALTAYAAFVIVFREPLESALSAILHFVGAVL